MDTAPDYPPSWRHDYGPRGCCGEETGIAVVATVGVIYALTRWLRRPRVTRTAKGIQR